MKSLSRSPRTRDDGHCSGLCAAWMRASRRRGLARRVLRSVAPLRYSRIGELALYKLSAHCAPVRGRAVEQSRAGVGPKNTTKAELVPQNSDESRPTGCMLVRTTHGRRPVTLTACLGVEMTSNRDSVLEAESRHTTSRPESSTGFEIRLSSPWVIGPSVTDRGRDAREERLTSIEAEHRVAEVERS